MAAAPCACASATNLRCQGYTYLSMAPEHKNIWVLKPQLSFTIISPILL